MKVFVVPSWYPIEDRPNRGIFFKEQAEALQKFGHEVIVLVPELVSLREMNKKTFNGIHKEKINGLTTYKLFGYNILPKLKQGRRILFDRLVRRLFERAIDEEGTPDIIHAHSVFWAGTSAALIAKKYQIPFVITEHATAYSRNLIEEYQVPYIKRTFENAARVIAVGKGLKKDLQAYTSADKIKVIPNIVDTSKFYLPPNAGEKNKFRFFSLALLTHKKGMDILIKAFANKFKGKSNIELVIGGDGEERANLERLASDMGVKDQVIFLGELNREQAVREMQQCDCFILASRFETFGVVYIEALACGKPIIGTRTGGPDGIINEKNGFLVDVEDVNGLEEAMENIKNHIDKFNPQEIREDCINRFSDKAVVQALTELYQEVVNQ